MSDNITMCAERELMEAEIFASKKVKAVFKALSALEVPTIPAFESLCCLNSNLMVYVCKIAVYRMALAETEVQEDDAA